jgi:hypothetical protein
MGRDGSVGIATRYGLEGPEIESLWGEVFQNGPGAHPASRTHPPPSAEVKERTELYLYSHLWAFVACFRVYF